MDARQKKKLMEHFFDDKSDRQEAKRGIGGFDGPLSGLIPVSPRPLSIVMHFKNREQSCTQRRTHTGTRDHRLRKHTKQYVDFDRTMSNELTWLRHEAEKSLDQRQR